MPGGRASWSSDEFGCSDLREHCRRAEARTQRPPRRDVIDRNLRVNEQIRISPVRVINTEGELLGVMPTGKAMEAAREAGLAEEKSFETEAASGPGQGNPGSAQDRRPRHRGQGQAGSGIPRTQGQSPRQRPLPRPGTRAHRRRPKGHERSAGGARRRGKGREEPLDGRQENDRHHRASGVMVDCRAHHCP